MRQDCKDFVRKVRDLHLETHRLVSEWKAQLGSGMGGNETDIVDLAYATNEMYKWADDVRKQLKQVHEIAERVACLILVTKGVGESVKTEYCSASPHVKQMASVPSRKTKPEEFAKLMDHLGIPRQLWDVSDDDEVVRPHWPGLMAYLTRLGAEGKPLPPGVDPDKTYAVYSLLIRPRKGVLTEG